MKNNDVLTLKKNTNTPLIKEERLIRMRRTLTSLKRQGVKSERYNTIITNCGSCGNWSSKQKCNLTDV